MYHKFYPLFQGRTYAFSVLLGVLWSKSSSRDTLQQDGSLLRYVDNPFLLQCRERCETTNSTRSYYIRLYIRLLIFCCKHLYPAAYLLSLFRFEIYENSGEALQMFRKIAKGDQRLLCLPRSIFAATTSKRFKEHGVMYIGVFLPSRHMHAWVIEDGMQADIYDNCWIEYTPVCMMK